jgi:predicted nucleotidyltransferase
MAPSDVLALLLGKAANRDLVDSLLQARVAFVVVGGTALATYNLREPLEVDDLDLLISPTRDNAETVAAVLQKFGVSLSAAALAKPAVQLSLKSQQFWAEVLTPVRGVQFEQIRERASLVQVQHLQVPVASVEDLRSMKVHAVSELRKSLEKHERDLVRLRDA